MMEKELDSNPDYADIELVDTVYGDDDDQKSFDQTEALLQNHPDLKGIISPTTVGIAAAARYLSESDSKGKVALTGLGTPNQMREYVEDGTVEAFALWNPGDLGYLATYAAAALVNGDITGEEGDTFEAGDLGEFEVGADGVVLLGEPFTFDADEHRRLRLLSPSGRSWRAGRDRRTLAGRDRGDPTRRTGDTDAARVLPAPGPADRHRGVRRAPRRGLARDARGTRATPGGTTTPCSCARTGCSSATSRPRRSTPRRPAWPRTEVNARWQAEMAEFFDDLDDARPTRASSSSARSSTSRTSSPPTRHRTATDAPTHSEDPT